ncbi:MAG: DUF2793 domain-containing protein [Sphingorhabdus sp.]
MPDDATARHSLPNLYVGQAQKEITHNEALARIDALLYPVVEAELALPPTGLTSSSDGLCWLIGSAAIGQWEGRTGQIARWSDGSWRYISPVEGMTVWLVSGSKRLFYIGGDWNSPSAINSPVGGAVIDLEARAAIEAILGHLRQISNIP